MGSQREVIQVTIPNGGTTSAEVNVGGRRIVGIQMPAAWTAGTIAFQALIDQSGSTPVWGNVVDAANAAISVATPTAGTYMALPTSLALVGLGRIKVVAGAAQGADRVLRLVTVDY
jgi:hypothetical protein